MNVLIQMVSSFISALCFGVIVNVPRRVLVHCGLTGLLGWMMNCVLLHFGVNIFVSVFFGAAVVSICSIVYAKKLKIPTTTFTIPGVFPMVPGIAAYQSMNALMVSDFMLGMSLLMKTFTISITIALAIVMIESLYKTYVRLRAQF